VTKGVRFLGGESIQGEENLQALQAGVRCPPSLLIFLPRLLELAVMLGECRWEEVEREDETSKNYFLRSLVSSHLVSPLRVSLL